MREMSLPLASSPARSRPIAESHPTQLALRTFDIPRVVRLWHLASLDAPTVAIVWSLAFASAAGIRLPGWVPLLLALGTWTVYIGDRLLDARSAITRSDLQALHERHFFHWRHRRILIPAAIASAAAAALLIFTRMPFGFRERNAVLAAAAIAYFSGVHLPSRPRFLRPLFSKELLVGVLFTAGCSLPTLSRLRLPIEATPHLPLAFVLIAFAATAWLNCFAIDRWESGVSRTGVIAPAIVCAAAGLLSAVFCSSAQPRSAALLAAIATSACLLAILDRVRQRLTPIALRASADLALLTPIVLLLR